MADTFATLLRCASAQVEFLAENQSQDTSRARLAALYRLFPAIAEYLPADVTMQVAPIGPSRPHALTEKTRVREAVVHAVLLLELQGGLRRTESSINRNLWKIERIAADFLTEQHRVLGGSDMTRVSPKPVTAPTIKTWVRRYEADPVRGLYDKRRRHRRPVGRDIDVRWYASRTGPSSLETARHEVPSNIVPLQTGGQGLSPTFVPWWLKDFS